MVVRGFNAGDHLPRHTKTRIMEAAKRPTIELNPIVIPQGKNENFTVLTAKPS